jgi:hypothetical protein
MATLTSPRDGGARARRTRARFHADCPHVVRAPQSWAGALGAADSFAALGGDSLPVALAAVILFALPKLSFPRMLSRRVFMIAGASFFIYLLQFKFLLLINHGLHLPVAAAFVGAVAGGVAAWPLWNRGLKLAKAAASKWQGRWRPGSAWLPGLARPAVAR